MAGAACACARARPCSRSSWEKEKKNSGSAGASYGSGFADCKSAVLTAVKQVAQPGHMVGDVAKVLFFPFLGGNVQRWSDFRAGGVRRIVWCVASGLPLFRARKWLPLLFVLLTLSRPRILFRVR